MEQMYKGMPFSPTATLTANISATDTIIPVSDVDAFPDAPNIATVGSIAGPNETIIYTGKTTTSLTGCTRGVEGTASDWAVDELIGRNFTAKDHADMVKNIEELESNKLDVSYKVDVVNTTDVSVGGKALDARQNNPNITGTLAQKVDSNTQQINALNSTAIKGFISEVTNDFNEALTQGEYRIVCGGLIQHCPPCWTSGGGFGKLIVTVSDGKTHNNTDNWIWQTAYFTEIRWGVWRRQKVNGGDWTDWELISTIVATPALLNGWSQYAGHQPVKLIKTGKMTHLVGFVNAGITDFGTTILSGIPSYMCPVDMRMVAIIGDLDIRVAQDGTISLMGSSVGQGGGVSFNGICWESV